MQPFFNELLTFNNLGVISMFFFDHRGATAQSEQESRQENNYFINREIMNIANPENPSKSSPEDPQEPQLPHPPNLPTPEPPTPPAPKSPTSPGSTPQPPSPDRAAPPL
jgi:hypothetical protein